MSFLLLQKRFCCSEPQTLGFFFYFTKNVWEIFVIINFLVSIRCFENNPRTLGTNNPDTAFCKGFLDVISSLCL